MVTNIEEEFNWFLKTKCPEGSLNKKYGNCEKIHLSMTYSLHPEARKEF
jgi:hypothetical protein